MSDPNAPAETISDEFTLEIVAAAEDVDELGHISNVCYVRWVQDVAKAHSSSVGWDYAAYVRAGAVFVVRRHEIEYVVPAYAGDAIRLVTWVQSWRGATCERRTRIERAADGRELARGVTQWVLVAAPKAGETGGRPRRIPPDIVAAFAKKKG